MVFSKNTIFSLFYLVASFFFGSILMVLQHSEFLALVVIVIYIGALTMLFLFAIMMLDIQKSNVVKVSFVELAIYAAFILFNLFFLFCKVFFHPEVYKSNYNTLSMAHIKAFQIYEEWLQLRNYKLSWSGGVDLALIELEAKIREHRLYDGVSENIVQNKVIKDLDCLTGLPLCVNTKSKYYVNNLPIEYFKEWLSSGYYKNMHPLDNTPKPINVEDLLLRDNIL